MSNIVIEKLRFSKDEVDNFNKTELLDYPVLYLLEKTGKPNKADIVGQMYIGESTQVKVRLKAHLKNPERKFFTRTTVIGNEYFNKSATLNIETNLINSFIGDGRYVLQNISQTRQKVMHNYYNKRYYDEELFGEIWEELRQLDLAKSSIEDLKNRDIFKLSPFKELSQEQYDLKINVIDFCEENVIKDSKSVYLIEGEAGTGKSVVLSSIYNALSELSHNVNSTINNKSINLLVNHEEMIKTYRSIAKSLPNLKSTRIMKPTSFLTKMKNNKTVSDVTIVDEAHLLLTMADSYNNFNEDNHLEEIIKNSKVTIIIFDEKQSLKFKSLWDEKLLKKIVGNSNIKREKLTHQFRMNSSIEMVKWIDSFVEDKKVLPIPDEKEFDFRIFDSAKHMYENIIEKNNEHKLSRMVSTFDYLHKKDGSDYYVETNDFKLPWNKTFDSQKAWAEMNTINEVGSIYTIHGFDLNYVGVILGPSIDYDEINDEIIIDSTKYMDKEAFKNSKSFDNADKLKEKIILNSINVLMKRGVNGLYIYAVNEKLRNKLLNSK